MLRRRNQEHSTSRESSGNQSGTELIVLDARARPLAQATFDFESLQAEAESAARNGDPIRILADVIVSSPLLATVAFDNEDRLALESALLAATMKGHWPARLAVQGKTFTATSTRDGRMKKKVDSAEPIGSTPETNGSDRRMPADPDKQPASGLISTDLFEEHIRYPSNEAADVYDGLVGLDGIKSRLVKEAILLTHPERLERWSKKHHSPASLRAVAAFSGGTPFLIFAGDVGTGKTVLAQSFGDAVARELGEPVSLLRMSIQTRGSGIVGDMTRQIAKAFRAVEQEARRTDNVTILLLDEADTLAESRETQQMHHEDRAGVNALIQGVDHLRGGDLPVLVVFCSNRLNSIDPAIRRRAVDVIEFHRPGDAQRRDHLSRLFGDIGLSEPQLEALVRLTGPRDGLDYGFTYSDISDRFARNAVLEAFPDRPLDFDLLQRIAQGTVATRPFNYTDR
jgi:hypothetical protein